MQPLFCAGVGAEIVLTVDGELPRHGCSGRTSRRSWPARFRTRARCRGKGMGLMRALAVPPLGTEGGGWQLVEGVET